MSKRVASTLALVMVILQFYTFPQTVKVFADEALLRNLDLSEDCRTILQGSQQANKSITDRISDEDILIPISESFVSGKEGGASCGRIINCLQIAPVITYGKRSGESLADWKKRTDGLTAHQQTSLSDKQVNDELKKNYPHCLVFGKTGINIIQNYAQQIYRWAAGLVGVVCVLIIILSGIEISMSGASGEDQSAAKDRIKNALIGLAILFLSAFILYTINPIFFI